MSDVFNVNGKSYIAKPFSFRMLKDFGKMGVDINDVENDPIPIITAYFRICSGLDEESALDEITNIDDVTAISEALAKVMDEGNGGFFHSRKDKAKKSTSKKVSNTNQ